MESISYLTLILNLSLTLFVLSFIFNMIFAEHRESSFSVFSRIFFFTFLPIPGFTFTYLLMWIYSL